MTQKKNKPKEESQKVSAGAIDKVTDYAFNPTREKIREMTYITILQAAYFPILDTIDAGREYLLNVANYRQLAALKETTNKSIKLPEKPKVPNLLNEFIYRTAQWRKSVKGYNLGKATDLALAEIEARAAEDSYKEDFGDDGDDF